MKDLKDAALMNRRLTNGSSFPAPTIKTKGTVKMSGKDSRYENSQDTKQFGKDAKRGKKI